MTTTTMSHIAALPRCHGTWARACVEVMDAARVMATTILGHIQYFRPCSFSPSDQAETTMTSFNVNEARFEGHSPTLYTTPLHFLNATLYNSFFSFSTTLLWWDYSEGGSKYGSGCLNFDQDIVIVKMSREFLYKVIHVIILATILRQSKFKQST